MKLLVVVSIALVLAGSIEAQTNDSNLIQRLESLVTGGGLSGGPAEGRLFDLVDLLTELVLDPLSEPLLNSTLFNDPISQLIGDGQEFETLRDELDGYDPNTDNTDPLQVLASSFGQLETNISNGITQIENTTVDGGALGPFADNLRNLILMILQNLPNNGTDSTESVSNPAGLSPPTGTVPRLSRAASIH